MSQQPDPHSSQHPRSASEHPRRGKCSRCGVEFSYASVASHPSFPFCSQRCRDVDLGNWFIGKYAIPCEEPLAEDEAAELAPERDAT